MEKVKTYIQPFIKDFADFVIPNLPYILIVLFGCLYLYEFIAKLRK